MKSNPTPYDCYIDYLALKNHFTVDNYDYFRYNGKVKSKYSSFENRRDRYYFEKLSRKKNPHLILLSNIQDDPDRWIGDIVSNEENYLKWKKRNTNQLYNFCEEIKTLFPNIEEKFEVKGDYPELLKLMQQGQISKETVIILNEILRFTSYWNKKIKDEIVWPKIFFNLKKYSAFLNVDRYKYKDHLIKIVKDNTYD